MGQRGISFLNDEEHPPPKLHKNNTHTHTHTHTQQRERERERERCLSLKVDGGKVIVYRVGLRSE
jgi:hypothetical protein